jgi:hypothetical protein
MAFNFTAASTQYLSTASAPASGTPMTIACWCKTTAFTNVAGRAAVSVGVANGTHRNQINVNNTNAQLFAIGASGTGQSANIALGGNNVLFHYAGVFESSTSRTAYINGVVGATNTTNIGSQNAANTITIGARWNGSLGNYYNNDISEVGIWNVALTAAEIASLAGGMTCDKVRPQSLVFYAPLVRNLQDVKGGLTITNNNTAPVAAHPRVYA